VRVGTLLRQLLVVLTIGAASIGIAVLLLGGDSSGVSEGESQASGHRERTQMSEPAAGDRPAVSESGESSPAGNPDEQVLTADAVSSWRSLLAAQPAQMGVAIAPLDGGKPLVLGSLRSGHAWSTIKVPILVSLLRERGELSAAEEAWARAALTASDNEAAAALFGRLEKTHGGLDGASRAVEATLRRAGDGATVVATAPPPPGAVSTYGQTEWSLPAAAELMRQLARGCLLDRIDTDYVLGLMEEVVPEQRWGLGQTGFQPSWRVALKGGWGPEGSATGPYLVRQMGLLRRGDAGAAIAMIARADSGSFEAGVEALDRVGAWLAENLADPSSPSRSC
jgi:hypothetical protein